MEKFLAELAESTKHWLPPLIGSIVDYLNQMMAGTKSKDWLTFFVHISTGVFFGWLTGTMAAGMNYSVDVIAVYAGFGGYLGVRAADQLTKKMS